MARTARATSYDEVPYAADPYPSSHPGHLAVVATLAGLSPASVCRWRVLELGCARGGNLIPMAVGLPGSSFVGIDSSAGQVATARGIIETLGLEQTITQSVMTTADLGHADDNRAPWVKPTGDRREERDFASDLLCCYKLKLVEFHTHTIRRSS